MILFTPSIIELLLIITAPFHRKIMYFLPDGTYHHGEWWNLLYVVAAFYTIYGFFFILHKREQFTKSQIIVCLSYTTLAIMSYLFQAAFPTIFATGFIVSISVLLIYLSIRNPSRFIDSKLQIFNVEAFIDRFNDLSTLTAKEHYFLIIHIQNLEELFDQFGIEKINQILRDFSFYIMKLCKDNSYYALFSDSYVYYCNTKDELNDKLKLLENSYIKSISLNDKNETPDRKYPFKVQFFIIEDYTKMHVFKMTDNKNIDEFLNLLRFIFNQNYIKDDTKLIVTAEMEKDYLESLDIQNRVKEAVKSEDFEVFIQPIYDLHKNTFTRGEALVRLKDKNGQLILPEKFIPQAELNGDIVKIGEIVLKKTCRFIKDTEITQQGLEKININISIIQCMQDNIVEKLTSIIDSFSLPHNIFRFEITESMIAKNEKLLVSVMNEFHNHGIELALDDYGNGYSNTARLMQYKYSEIKFDKSLITEIETNEYKRLMVKHHILMMKETGDTLVLAEGVETKELSDLLRILNCDYIQGFYYAKPMNIEDFTEFMKTHR
ncbi:MAG: EAL domain-containing protein [Treponema sp.]|nr:EAL domain-containing protein [Treponema sp.]